MPAPKGSKATGMLRRTRGKGKKLGHAKQATRSLTPKAKKPKEEWAISGATFDPKKGYSYTGVTRSKRKK